MIADDLLSDAGSALAPTLQVLLTNMWKRAREANPARPRFDRALYESLKSQGYLLQDVLDDGLKAIGRWNAEAAGSGLPLDLLRLSHDRPGDRRPAHPGRAGAALRASRRAPGRPDRPVQGSLPAHRGSGRRRCRGPARRERGWPTT